MSGPRTMFDKIWQRHIVTEGPGGQTLLYVDRHLLHEGSASAFTRLEKSGRRVRRPDRCVATADHYLPTTPPGTAIPDRELGMVESLTRSHARARHRVFGVGDSRRGIVHVIVPSKASRTRSAPGVRRLPYRHPRRLGAVAFGIGITEVEHVLPRRPSGSASPRYAGLRRRRVERGVTAKDW